MWFWSKRVTKDHQTRVVLVVLTSSNMLKRPGQVSWIAHLDRLNKNNNILAPCWIMEVPKRPPWPQKGRRFSIYQQTLNKLCFFHALRMDDFRGLGSLPTPHSSTWPLRRCSSLRLVAIHSLGSYVKKTPWTSHTMVQLSVYHYYEVHDVLELEDGPTIERLQHM